MTIRLTAKNGDGYQGLVFAWTLLRLVIKFVKFIFVHNTLSCWWNTWNTFDFIWPCCEFHYMMCYFKNYLYVLYFAAFFWLYLWYGRFQIEIVAFVPDFHTDSTTNLCKLLRIILCASYSLSPLAHSVSCIFS